jgi:serine/threonine protein kinase
MSASLRYFVMAIEKLGPYKIEKLLGRGGMGAVYVGVDESTGDRAAVKVLASHLVDNEDFRYRFQAEVEAHKRLKHPNIIQILGFGVEGDHLYYAMELINGASLQDLLQKGKLFSWRETLRVGIAVCSALKLAHAHGVIHRDLKPANLMMGVDGTIKLTDFGIAKDWNATSMTAAGGVLGTADYMAPEQAEGKPVTPRSDLYSLGSVLYALLTGRPPFAAKTLAEVIHGLRFEKPIPVRRLAPDAPAELDEIIAQLLEKDPQRRIANATALGKFFSAMDLALNDAGNRREAPSKDEAEILPATDPLRVAASHDVTQIVSASPKTEMQPTGGATSPLHTNNDNVSVDLHLAREARLETEAAPESMAPSKPTLRPATTGAGRSVFVTVAEEERKRNLELEREEAGPPLWIAIPGLLILLIAAGGVAWWATRPPTADSLYQKISTAAINGDAALLEVAGDIDRFKKLYPTDVRFADLDNWTEDIELFRTQRRLERPSWRAGGSDPSTPVEQLYLDAVKLKSSEPERAQAKFQAVASLFSDVDNSSLEEGDRKAARQCVELAKRQLKKLDAMILAIANKHRPLIEQQIARGEGLAASSPNEARTIWQGLVELYGDKPWSNDLIEPIRKKLAELPPKDTAGL